MSTPNPKHSADGGRGSPEGTAARTNRRQISRAFVPERKSGHPLWQWVLVIAVRMAAVPVATFVLLTGIAFCQSVTGTGSLGSFNLMGFNRTDRSIAEFYVDGGWGGNVFRQGQGGITCCTSIPRRNKTLHVRWVLDWRTAADADRNLPLETYEADVPMPPNPDLGDDNYLQVYFFPGNRIGVHLGQHTFDYNIQSQVTGTRVADTSYND